MNGVRVEYNGVALGANADFVPVTTDKASFVDLQELQEDNLNFRNVGNPCELYSVLLDGNSEMFPTDTESEPLGWWSSQISNDDGTFTDPITLTLTATSKYLSSGITLTFDEYNNIFATSISISWYSDSTLLDTVEYTPDSATYFCAHRPSQSFNKLVIKFMSINMPRNRLKLRVIDYGLKITFLGDELRDCKITQEIDPISSQISINTCNFTIGTSKKIDFVFQEKQSFDVYFNDVLRAKSFLKSSSRKDKTVWDIQCEDYIGVMESTVFYGDIYTEKDAETIIGEIFAKAKVPYSLADELKTKTVTGYIPYTDCRTALMHVAFAIGAAVDTSNSDKVNIYPLSDTVSDTIPLNRIMQGQSFGESATVTAVEITAHKYNKLPDTSEVYTAENNVIGNNIFLRFSEPMADLSIKSGTIIESGTNYVRFNAYSGCVITGKKYEHLTTVHRRENDTAISSEPDNIITVQDATLVSNDNVSDVIDRCYNRYVGAKTVNLKIYEGKHKAYSMYGMDVYGNSKYMANEQQTYDILEPDSITQVGQLIKCETAYLGTITGRIVKQAFNLRGNAMVKDTVLN